MSEGRGNDLATDSIFGPNNRPVALSTFAMVWRGRMRSPRTLRAGQYAELMLAAWHARCSPESFEPGRRCGQGVLLRLCYASPISV